MSTPANSINESGAAGLVTFDGVATFATTPVPAVRYPITKYVVGPLGDAGYQTIQSALDAANTAGDGGVVWIMPRPTPYVENLTFYNGSQIVGANADSFVPPATSNVIIQGTHTPPATGTLSVYNIIFSTSSDVFSSTAAGNAILVVLECGMAISTGYLYNLPNWVGVMSIANFQDNSSDSGAVNNTAGGIVFIQQSVIGQGTSFPIITAGPTVMRNNEIGCDWNAGAGTVGLVEKTTYSGQLTFSGSSSLNAIPSNFNPHSGGPAITWSSTDGMALTECIINTTNNPAIAGSGTGAINLNSVTFSASATIANTLTVSPEGGLYPAGNLGSVGDVWTSNGNGVVPTFQTPVARFPITQFVVGPVGLAGYQTIQSAVTAANGFGGGVVYVMPGSYTENLTLFPTTQIVGTPASNQIGAVSIVGTHTPPTSGFVSFRDLFLVGAPDVFNSAAAGTTLIFLTDCNIEVSNGFTFNLTNWIGPFLVYGCTDASSNNGFSSNTGGSLCVVERSDVGAGTANTWQLSAENVISHSTVNCPLSANTGSQIFANEVVYTAPVTFTANSNASYIETTFNNASPSSSITWNSTGTLTLVEGSINSSVNPAIAGTGTGTIQLNTVSFTNDAHIAPGLTISTAGGLYPGGNVGSSGDVWTSNGPGVVPTFQTLLTRYPITKYVVGPVGFAPYQTIQSALDAANTAADGGVVWIMPSPTGYTENLTFYDGSQIVGANGSSLQEPNVSTVVIIGTHTPPTSGNVTCYNIDFNSATDVFSSAAAGTTTILVVSCTFTIANGYSFNLLNWTGVVAFLQCQESSNTNGIFNNTGGGALIIENSSIGAGSTLPLTTVSVCEMINSSIGCPWNATVNSVGILSYTAFAATITVSDNSIMEGIFCNFAPVSGPAFSLSTDNFIILSESIVNSPNTPSIDGVSGGVSLGSVTFWADSTISGSLTVTPFGNIYPAGNVGPTGYILTSNSVSAVPTFQAPQPLLYSDVSTTGTSVVNSGEFVTAAVTRTLPSAPAEGNTVEYVVTSVAIMVIQASPGQSIRLGITLSAVAGTATSTTIGNTITLKFRSADQIWYTTSSTGSWTVV